jgi:hypothetical protein
MYRRAHVHAIQLGWWPSVAPQQLGRFLWWPLVAAQTHGSAKTQCNGTFVYTAPSSQRYWCILGTRIQCVLHGQVTYMIGTWRKLLQVIQVGHDRTRSLYRTHFVKSYLRFLQSVQA